jgi:hypothetical protein
VAVVAVAHSLAQVAQHLEVAVQVLAVPLLE